MSTLSTSHTLLKGNARSVGPEEQLRLERLRALTDESKIPADQQMLTLGTPITFRYPLGGGALVMISHRTREEGSKREGGSFAMSVMDGKEQGCLHSSIYTCNGKGQLVSVLCTKIDPGCRLTVTNDGKPTPENVANFDRIVERLTKSLPA